MLTNEEKSIEELILTVENRLCQFEENVSCMQRRISEFKTIQKQFHEKCNENWVQQVG
ncbi:hypothetical protein [Kurthia senegalensis]|uniref:hypothetical protein n=1 Tax=Kurthia senegalensis TaxID=1033740 RepID=UPI0002F1D510|nr:hypothetical protein [Kurthia senegalensis]